MSALNKWLGAVGSLAFVASAANAAPSYTFVELNTFPGSPFSQIIGMNNLAQTAGAMDQADGTRRAVIWNPDGSFVDIGTLGGRSAFVSSVTDAGMGFGYAEVPAGARHAFRYTRGVMEDLGTLGGATSTAVDGNASGAAAGQAQRANGQLPPAYWAPGSRTAVDLETFGGPEGLALSINSNNVVVGRAEDPLGYKHAFRWTPGGTLERLGEPAGWDGSRAHGINTSGRMAGWLETGVPAGPPFGAIVWDAPNVFKVLPHMPGWVGAQAYAINDSGLVAGRGWFADGSFHAALWDGDAIYDLHELSGASTLGYRSSQVYDINDRGDVSGFAVRAGDGQLRAFLMVSAIPEPQTYAMLLAGLLLMGHVARRRKGH